MSNPFKPPNERACENRLARPSRVLGLAIAWIATLLLNMIVPFQYARPMINVHGSLGVTLSVAAIFQVRLMFVFVSQIQMARIILGGIFVAALQWFPVLQLAFGFLGWVAAEQLGHARMGEFGFHFESEFGALLATLISGGLLLLSAWLSGLVLEHILPKTFRVHYDRSFKPLKHVENAGETLAG